MSFFDKYKKEILLGAVMAAAGTALFFAGGYLSGEQMALPSFGQKEAMAESMVPGGESEEKLSGDAASDADIPVSEVVNAGEERQKEEESPEPGMPGEQEAQEAAGGEKTETPPAAAKETESTASEAEQSEEEPKKEETDPEAEKRREEGRFIGQIDAIIAAENAWNTYPGQIPEGYDARSGYTYDTYISKNPSRDEPWYEITLCISNHKNDTIIDKRAIVDAYSGKVRE